MTSHVVPEFENSFGYTAQNEQSIIHEFFVPDSTRVNGLSVVSDTLN